MILRFSNGSIGKFAKELEPLEHAITDILVSELSTGSSIHVIEASQLSLPARSTDGISGGTARAVQVARDLGAARAVFGGYAGDASGDLRITARVVDVRTATVLFTVTVTGKQEAILASLASVGAKVRCRVEMKRAAADCPSQVAQVAARADSAVKSPFKPTMAAALSYGRTLSTLDQGDTSAAFGDLRQLLAKYPDWQVPRDLLKKLTPLPPPRD